MFLLKKVFQLREQASGDGEKPFLEHLEDLRVMLTRVAITIVVSTLVCFAFQEKVMEVLRKPVNEVSLRNLQNKLPKDPTSGRELDAEVWMQAQELALGAKALEGVDRKTYFAAIKDDQVRLYTRCVLAAEAAVKLPVAVREAFLRDLEPGDDELSELVLAVLDGDPKMRFDGSSDLRFMSALKPPEAFMLSIKISFFSGLVISFPLLLLFILQFVVPGLRDAEKRVLFPALGIAFFLFLVGVCFAYFLVLPRVLFFFFDWSEQLGVTSDWRIGYYISFATQFTLMFGLSFELPVVVMSLVKLGILSYPLMASSRSYAILAIFVIAAILTPTPDIPTLTFMALPMVLLYELCIWLTYILHRKEKKREAAEEAEYAAYLERRRKNRELSGGGHDDDEGDDDGGGDDDPPIPRRPSNGPKPTDPDELSGVKSGASVNNLADSEMSGKESEGGFGDEIAESGNDEASDDDWENWKPEDAFYDEEAEKRLRDPIEFEQYESEQPDAGEDAEEDKGENRDDGMGDDEENGRGKSS